MGCDAKLLINPIWDANEILSLCENLFGKCEVSQSHTPDYWMIHLLDKKPRMINVFYSASYSIGTFTMLDMSADEMGKKTLRTIAERIGGFLMENDCGDAKYEDIQGQFRLDDGELYKLKRKVLTGE